MNNKSFWFIVIIAVGITLLVGKIRQTKLSAHYDIAEGYVTQVLPGGVTGGGIQFKFADNRTKYYQSISFSITCEYKIESMLPEIKKKKFPIAFDPFNNSNSEILLLKSQYEKYGVVIPRELEEIVLELSKCE